MKIAEKLKQTAVQSIRENNVTLRSVSREEGVTTYNVLLAGFIPLPIRFETHVGRRKSHNEAHEDWERLQTRFLKRYRKLIERGTSIEYSLEDCPEADGIRHVWSNRIQARCILWIPGPINGLSTQFFIPEEFAADCEDYDKRLNGALKGAVMCGSQ